VLRCAMLHRSSWFTSPLPAPAPVSAGPRPIGSGPLPARARDTLKSSDSFPLPRSPQQVLSFEKLTCSWRSFPVNGALQTLWMHVFAHSLTDGVHLYHSTQLSRPLFSYICALFCTPRNLNPFVFKDSRTLCEKHAGWGEGVFGTSNQKLLSTYFSGCALARPRPLPRSSNAQPRTSRAHCPPRTARATVGALPRNSPHRMALVQYPAGRQKPEISLFDWVRNRSVFAALCNVGACPVHFWAHPNLW